MAFIVNGKDMSADLDRHITGDYGERQLREEPRYLFVYGSLRMGEYNHRLLTNARLIGKRTIGGFKMYSLGSYPFVTETGNEDDKIVGEVYEIDEDEYLRIRNMELGARYYEVIRNITFHNDLTLPCIIYARKVGCKEQLLRPVSGGDWVDYQPKITEA
jgi:gamma-glutamylcyclotransferase (GGCT)/AIG2-like uncharacterized protein YtfP